MIRTVNAFLLLALSSFAFHGIWERLHIHLYTGYEALQGTLPVYIFASLGDVQYTFFAVLLVAIFKRELTWFQEARLSDFLGLALFGLGIALFVEYKAQALLRWTYTDSMPLIFGLGLSPLVQMTVLLPLSVYAVMCSERWFIRRGTKLP